MSIDFIAPTLPKGYFFRVRYVSNTSRLPVVELKRKVIGRLITIEKGWSIIDLDWRDTDVRQGIKKAMESLKDKYFPVVVRDETVVGDYPPRRYI